MKTKNEKQFKKLIMERAMQIAEVESDQIEMPAGKSDVNRDVTNFEDRFEKIKSSVQSVFNSINSTEELEQVLEYIIDEFKYATDSAKITAIRKVLATKSKSATQKA
jgi:hypothetical protein